MFLKNNQRYNKMVYVQLSLTINIRALFNDCFTHIFVIKHTCCETVFQ